MGNFPWQSCYVDLAWKRGCCWSVSLAWVVVGGTLGSPHIKVRSVCGVQGPTVMNEVLGFSGMVDETPPPLSLTSLLGFLKTNVFGGGAHHFSSPPSFSVIFL